MYNLPKIIFICHNDIFYFLPRTHNKSNNLYIINLCYYVTVPLRFQCIWNSYNSYFITNSDLSFDKITDKGGTANTKTTFQSILRKYPMTGKQSTIKSIIKVYKFKFYPVPQELHSKITGALHHHHFPEHY